MIAMPNYPIPENEQKRLQQLELYNLLDPMEEACFNRITRILARTLGTPMALITLVDADRQRFKSRIGIDITESPREHAFCAHAICTDEIMVVEDAHLDDRFSNSPLVLNNPSIRFYAGAPLQVEGGFSLGTLCTMDTKPRTLNEQERTLLVDLASMVVDQIELRQITERAIKAENRLIDAVESIPDGFVLYDHEDKLVMCNQRYKEIYAESADLFIPGASFYDIIRKGVERGQYPEAIGNEEAWIESRMWHHHHSERAVEQELPGDRWLRIEERITSEGGLVGFRVDITQLKRQQRELSRLAWTDSLTGALNRRRFVDLVGKELKRAQRGNMQTALLLIDVDHFKKINDVFGHAAGDTVLIELVKRWTLEMREYDHLARIGGEEFAILLPQCDGQGAAQVIERLLEKTSALPINIDDIDVYVTISAGLVVCSSEHDTVDIALARADEALYKAKNQGRNCYIARVA